jgi:hypothetical protein
VKEFRMDVHISSLDNCVGIFFVVGEDILFCGCILENGEPYGDFINYPQSHDEIWREQFQKKYGVDFDYYPRGRIIFNKKKEQYTLYFDGCVEDEAKKLQKLFCEGKCVISRDEH